MRDVFDSAECALMARALDLALAELGDQAGTRATVTRATLTHAIMEAAQHGLRSEAALAAYALLHARQKASAQPA